MGDLAYSVVETFKVHELPEVLVYTVCLLAIVLDSVMVSSLLNRLIEFGSALGR